MIGEAGVWARLRKRSVSGEMLVASSCIFFVHSLSVFRLGNLLSSLRRHNPSKFIQATSLNFDNI